MSIQDRLRRFIDVAYNKSVTALAKATASSRTVLYQYLRGDATPGRVWLERLSEAGCDIEWLLYGRGSMFANNEAGRTLALQHSPKVPGVIRETAAEFRLSPMSELDAYQVSGAINKEDRVRREIPLFLMPVSAGEGAIEVDDTIDRMIDLNDEILNRPQQQFVLTCRGGSMSDAGIFDGDMVVIERNGTPTPGQVVICAIDGRLTVKRFEIERNEIVLYPENEHFGYEPIRKFKRLSIYGQVTAIIRKVHRR